MIPQTVVSLHRVAEQASQYFGRGDWSYEHRLQNLWAPHRREGDNQAHVAEMRGWGYLIGGGGLSLPNDEAVQAQQHLAAFWTRCHPAAVADLAKYALEMEKSRDHWKRVAEDRLTLSVDNETRRRNAEYELAALKESIKPKVVDPGIADRIH